jgi:predicted ATPase/class 3 adenylate cyclase
VSDARGGGTVTLLFTDIEGSTLLAREVGDRWAELVARHHAILRSAIESNEGFVDGVEGDAFFAIFDSARGGVAAAIDAQRALRSEPWPGPAVKVRMGLHTGEIRRVATGFVGLDIHRAARVAASAHGGQVLLTRTTLELLGRAQRTEDLGLHRLKDFPEPERLFHLVIDGQTSERFPPPKTLRVRPTNVPVIETPLVGRRAELSEVHERLGDGTRLLTLTGPGGSGKTRLAIAAAEELLEMFPGGTWLVPLSDVDDADRILAVVADKLRLPESGEQSVLDTLSERLRAEPTMLVLDNLEHLRHASPIVHELLAAAPALKVLATSQAPLRVSGEYVLPLPPLPPDDGRELFLETAIQRRRGLDPERSAQAIDMICDRLDGLPLAIELAAARTVALSPEELLDRLVGSMELLRVREPDRPERLRSLRATLDWSFSLLASEDRELCSDLTVFATPFTVSDAEAIGQGDVLESLEQLLDFSFLRRVEAGGGETRFTMAQTVREFARERLAQSGRLDATERRHALWALALAEDGASDAATQPVAAFEGVLARLDDVYVALAWARAQDSDLHLQLSGAISDALIWVPPGSELDAELTIAVSGDPPPSPALGRALSALGVLKQLSGESRAAIVILERAAALWDGLGDIPRTIDALTSLVYPAIEIDPATAWSSAERAIELARELGDQAIIDQGIAALAQVAVATGDVEQAESLAGGALDSTDDLAAAIGLRHVWADCALIGGDPLEAAARYAVAIRSLPAVDQSPSVTVELEGLAMSLARAGRPEDALEVDRIAEAHGEHYHRGHRTPWWEALREQNLGLARAAAPAYAAAHPIDDLAAAREWALGLIDEH